MDVDSLLSAIAAGGANGSALADQLGVSRTAVWKAMEQLRREGVVIEGTAGEGYRLVNAAGFGAHTVSWRVGRPVHFHESCASTNIEARALADAMQTPAGTVVVANQQSAGRGRLGRTWDTETGCNLMFSVVLEPRVIPQYAPVCVLAWAAAMAAELDCLVKWPNDLVTKEGKKLGGILAELSAEAERVRFVVLGVGINVNQTDFPGLPLATSLAMESGSTVDRAELLGRLIRSIESVDVDGIPDLDPWRARSHTLGKRVRVNDVEGTALEVRDDGALLVDGVAVLAGDVELVGT
jgi:BirA family biotin operon repressor/biotin-[acetyl-CoA-carboxylase] ligase